MISSSPMTIPACSPSLRRSRFDGTLTFTPGADVSGTATVTVRLHDDGGTAGGGVDTTGVLTFTVTVVPRPLVLVATWPSRAIRAPHQATGSPTILRLASSARRRPGSLVRSSSHGGRTKPPPPYWEQHAAGLDGVWRLTSIPLADGTYLISANASGVGGAAGSLKVLGSITIDTVGPRLISARLRPRAGKVLLALRRMSVPASIKPDCLRRPTTPRLASARCGQEPWP